METMASDVLIQGRLVRVEHRKDAHDDLRERSLSNIPVYQGPYRADPHSENLHAALEEISGRRTPEPFTDVQLSMRLGNLRPNDCIFGFRDMSAMKRWFHTRHVRFVLREEGYVVRTYDCYCMHGERQSIMSIAYPRHIISTQEIP